MVKQERIIFGVGIHNSTKILEYIQIDVGRYSSVASLPEKW